MPPFDPFRPFSQLGPALSSDRAFFLAIQGWPAVGAAAMGVFAHPKARPGQFFLKNLL
jgi:hypothetical protein